MCRRSAGKARRNDLHRYAGMVIVLHTFARVDDGVSVAVILEVNDG